MATMKIQAHTPSTLNEGKGARETQGRKHREALAAHSTQSIRVETSKRAFKNSRDICLYPWAGDDYMALHLFSNFSSYMD